VDMSKVNSMIAQAVAGAQEANQAIYKQIVDLKNENIALRDQVNQVQEAPAAWPPGKYCIWKDGDCPAGFKPRTGYTGSNVRMNGDVKEVDIGDSKIEIQEAKCRSCVRRFGMWVKLDLKACCKDE